MVSWGFSPRVECFDELLAEDHETRYVLNEDCDGNHDTVNFPRRYHDNWYRRRWAIRYAPRADERVSHSICRS